MKPAEQKSKADHDDEIDCPKCIMSVVYLGQWSLQFGRYVTPFMRRVYCERSIVSSSVIAYKDLSRGDVPKSGSIVWEEELNS